MANRVTADELALIVGTGPTDEELTAFITDANLWVNAHLVGACTAMTDALLALIEKYLAADLSTVKYPVLKSQKVGPAQDVFAGAGNDTASQYLRKAAQIDPCGIVQDMLVAEGKVRGKFRVGAGYDEDHTGGS